MRKKLLSTVYPACFNPLRSLSLSPKCLKDKKDDRPPPDLPGSFQETDYSKHLSKENPIWRTTKILKRDFKNMGRQAKNFLGFESEASDTTGLYFPTHTDIVIIGGGAIGSSIAYWIKQRAPHSTDIVVIEKDQSYAESSTCLSVGGLRQQFSLPENVQMSLFGAEFLRNIDKHLTVDGYPAPDVQFQPHGYLFLASEASAAQLEANSKMQCSLGARNILLSPQKLKERFPWIDVTGVELGCLGLENEGWFDPWSLLNALKRKSLNYGVEYIQGNVVGYEFRDQPDMVAPSEDGKYEQLERVIVQMPNGDINAIKFGICIIAAGAQSGNIAKMARIGEGTGLLSIPLPIEPRKRFVYVLHCPEGPGLDTPLVIDTSGAYFRREGLGGNYIAGMSPAIGEEPPIDNLDVDYSFFDEKVWPLLSKRVPAFEKLKVKSGWAGYYEYNTMDENGVIGRHPFYHNLYIASGFSGHGIQHAPAVGRAVMELLLDGKFVSINLNRLSFERLCLGEPLNEINIV